MLEYSSGSERAKWTAAKGFIQAKVATIATGKTIRIPKTAISIPQVKNLWRQIGVISTNLFAFTIALSKDRAISSAAKTVPTSKNEKTALTVFSVSQPNQADNTKPIKVTIKGHFR
jgi:hypothetical protein